MKTLFNVLLSVLIMGFLIWSGFYIIYFAFKATLYLAVFLSGGLGGFFMFTVGYILGRKDSSEKEA